MGHQKRYCVGVLIGHERKKINTLCALDSPCFMASGGTDDLICIWRVYKERGHCLRRLIGHTDSVESICLVKEGVIASSSEDKLIFVWNYRTGEILRRIRCEASLMSMSVVGIETLFCGSSNQSVELYDIDAGELVQRRTIHERPVLQVISVQTIPQVCISISGEGLIVLFRTMMKDTPS
eukprot:TRINITY_DN1529_c0_g1_i1.p1 TRINITY_DN1529_c0_g1~~TRINITY_DN1529_c0_g1_i1.p1  ORF type:complete len:180 (+),score=1.00 TRINITY_DN1529_c0_g1_i1:432-971(+)